MTRDQRPSVIPILLVAAFVVILNETTMNVALTSITADLGITERTAQWLTTAFMLTMAVVIPITGWLLDRLPTTRVFVLALSLFSLGTLACAVARVFASISDEADLLRDSDSDGISAPNHSNAEGFLREVIRLAGGTVKRTLKVGASLAHALHHHTQDGHTH